MKNLRTAMQHTPSAEHAFKINRNILVLSTYVHSEFCKYNMYNYKTYVCYTIAILITLSRTLFSYFYNRLQSKEIIKQTMCKRRFCIFSSTGFALYQCIKKIASYKFSSVVANDATNSYMRNLNACTHTMLLNYIFL